MEIGPYGPVHLSWLEGLARIAAALVLSLGLGLERFLRKKPVDFRPFVIIALASCALMIGIIEFAYRSDDQQLSIDPARVISGTLTGIGFIGAGALFREQHTVQGAGSAASIWAAGAIGICCGLGVLWLAAILTIAIVLLLLLSKPFTDDYTIRVSDGGDDGGEKT